MTAQPVTKWQARSTWFSQKPYFLFPLGVLVIYSLIASKSPELLVRADKAITPLVGALHYIGLGVTKPFMDGPMPERYYANLVGIGVWGVVAYNLRSLLFLVKHRGLLNIVDTAQQQFQKKTGWNPGRVWLSFRLFLLLLILPLAAYSLLCLLNSTRGWLVFHVKDFLTPLLLILTFQASGAFLIGLLAPLATYLLHDIRNFLKFGHKG